MEIFSSPENFGADPPTGSASQNFTTLTNLYDGTGDPCAGQDKLKAVLEDLLTPEVVRSVENLGAEPPTGSAREVF